MKITISISTEADIVTPQMEATRDIIIAKLAEAGVKEPEVNEYTNGIDIVFEPSAS